MPFLHRIVPALLTSLRGVALPGEQPLLNLGQWSWILAAPAELTVSILGAHWVLSQHDPSLYPLLLLTFASGQAASWTFSMAWMHHSAHGNNSRYPWGNRLLGEVGSTLNLTTGFDQYESAHNSKHHRHLATKVDPDLEFMLCWGFKPGKSVDYYKAQLFCVLFSPGYYGESVSNRLKANFITAPGYRRAIAIAWWGFVFSFTAYCNAWPTLIVGYLLPITMGHSISVLLQTTTEHDWAAQKNIHKTFPRLLDVTAPNTGNPIVWAIYGTKMLVYIYWRLAILPTDLMQHQQHHHRPYDPNWANAAYTANTQRDFPQAAWGIRAHFQRVFEGLAKAYSKE